MPRRLSTSDPVRPRIRSISAAASIGYSCSRSSSGSCGLKGYLWTAFIFALLLYLYDAIILPVLSLRPSSPDQDEMPDDEPPPAPRGAADGNGIPTIPPDASRRAHHASWAGKNSAIRSS